MALIDWFNKNKKFLLPIIGIIAFFAYILIFNVNIIQLGDIIASINLFFFALAFFIGLAEMLFFAYSWRTLLSFLSIRISPKQSFLYVLYGYYMDILIPAGSITGDVARIYLIGKEHNGDETDAAASVVTQRLLGMALNVVTILLGIGLILTVERLNSTVIYYVISVGGVISFGIVLLLLLIAKESLSLKIINGALGFIDKISKNRWNISQWKERIDIAVDRFRRSMTTFTGHPRVLAVSMGYLVLNWVCSFSIPYVIFLSLNHPVPWSVVIITTSIAVTISAIPVGIPFQVGIPEITMTTLFIALGVPADIGATTTILTRIITLWFRFGLGFFAQQWIELKPKDLKIKFPR